MSVRPGLGAIAIIFWAALPAQAQQRAADSARGRSVEPEITEEGVFYTIVDGDTLSEVAERLDVSMDDLVRWNEGLEPDRLRVGQRLTIDTGQRRVDHVVRRGESLSRIAARFEVRVPELLRWNRRLRPDRIRAGQTVTIFTSVPSSRSRSVGAPSHGRLVDAAQLTRRHPGLFVRAPSRAYGTDETVRWIVDAYDALRDGDDDAPQVAVHDLSRRTGGEMMGHRSHRSGRDADIAYFQRNCGERCGFRRIGPERLDVARQWQIFQYWLEHERVEAIFVDHALQRALYQHAREQGVDRRQLSRWFQYPRPIGNRYGIIRHHPRHADHFHVRFVCHETDEECR